MSLKSILVANGLLNGLAIAANRISGKIYSTLFCFSIGHRGGGFFGRNCQVLGSKKISFGLRPYILAGAWIEAVTQYRGQIFSPKIRVGDFFCSSPGLHLSAIREIVIGDHCLFGSNVFITDHSHGSTADLLADNDVITFPAERPLASKIDGVRIGERCWLGNNVCILSASIGNDCIVGANAVITKDIPPYSIAVGIPARVIAQFDVAQKKWLKTT